MRLKTVKVFFYVEEYSISIKWRVCWASSFYSTYDTSPHEFEWIVLITKRRDFSMILWLNQFVFITLKQFVFFPIPNRFVFMLPALTRDSSLAFKSIMRISF